MSAFKRFEDRDKWSKLTPVNPESALEGEVTAKHILNIARIDDSEKRWGRIKGTFRMGFLGL